MSATTTLRLGAAGHGASASTSHGVSVSTSTA